MKHSASQAPFASPIPFSMLPATRPPWTEFLFSSVTQVTVVAALIWLRVMHPEIVAAPERTFRSIQLVSVPAPESRQPQTRPATPVFSARVEPASTLRLPAAAIKPLAKVEVAPTLMAAIAPVKKLEILAERSAPVIPRAVRTNVFSTGSSATPTITQPVEKVQTGGFGDSNGLPAQGSSGKAVNVAAQGSFDLPSGAGSGNGSGGASGTRGVVASAGFGSGVATGGNKPRTSTVQTSGFGDADVAAPPSARPSAAQLAPPVVPAEILSKPNPIYTQEAKSLRIEGEVLLEVVLKASGDLQIKRLVHGLGHGLDDSAVKAAGQIRFKPATRNGEPADSTVVLHIIFQLA